MPEPPPFPPQAPAHRHQRLRRRGSSRPRANPRPHPAAPKNRPSKNARTAPRDEHLTDDTPMSNGKIWQDHAMKLGWNYSCWLAWGLSHQVPKVENRTEIRVSEINPGTYLNDLRWSCQWMHSIGNLRHSATYSQNLPRRLKQLKEAWKLTHSVVWCSMRP